MSLLPDSSLVSLILDAVDSGVFVVESSENGHFVLKQANQPLCQLFRSEESLLIERNVTDILSGEEGRWFHHLLLKVEREKEIVERTVLTGCLGGEKVYLSLKLMPVLSGGVVQSVVGTVKTLENQPRVEDPYVAERDLCALALEFAPYGVAFVDDDGRPSMVNHMLSEWLDTGVSLLKARSILNWVHPEDRSVFAQVLRKMAQGSRLYNDVELRLVTKDGMMWVSVSLSRLLHGESGGRTVVQFVDISKRKQGEEELLRLATKDHLTGLYNRKVFEDSLQRSMKNAQRYHRHGAVIYIDLNDFKGVNDTYGHKAGDLVLQAAGRVLTSIFRDTDVVARIGGDEFAVIMDQVRPEEARWKAKQIEEAIKRIRVSAHGQSVGVGASAGVKIFDHETRLTSSDIVEEADKAMYSKKSQIKAANGRILNS